MHNTNSNTPNWAIHFKYAQNYIVFAPPDVRRHQIVAEEQGFRISEATLFRMNKLLSREVWLGLEAQEHRFTLLLYSLLQVTHLIREICRVEITKHRYTLASEKRKPIPVLFEFYCTSRSYNK